MGRDKEYDLPYSKIESCSAIRCKFNVGNIECSLKVTQIGKDGKCSMFSERTDDVCT